MQSNLSLNTYVHTNMIKGISFMVIGTWLVETEKVKLKCPTFSLQESKGKPDLLHYHLRDHPKFLKHQYQIHRTFTFSSLQKSLQTSASLPLLNGSTELQWLKRRQNLCHVTNQSQLVQQCSKLTHCTFGKVCLITAISV